jgi:hypothetical protein
MAPRDLSVYLEDIEHYAAAQQLSIASECGDDQSKASL